MIHLTPHQWLTFLHQCADHADELSRFYFKKNHLRVDTKENQTPVTEADLEIEKKIRQIAADTHPNLPIYAEEFGQCPEDALQKLIIDPIDGTQNFVCGIPFVATLLAIEEKGDIVAGVISCAPNDDRWWAAKNMGSFYKKTYNDTPTRIDVSTVDTLEKSQIFHGSLFGNEAHGSNTPNVLSLLKKSRRQRGFGDFYAPMFVASGAGECAIDFNLKPWDMASIKIIIEEAGGRFTDTHGKNSIYNGEFLVSNGHIHHEALDILNHSTK